MTSLVTTIARERPPGTRFGAAALAAAAAVGLLWLVTNVAPLEWPAQETEIVLDGARYRAGPEQLTWLESFTASHFAAGDETARALMLDAVDARLDAMFGEATARLPEFLDWYYSLPGEYGRIAMAALEAAQVTEPGYVAQRAASILLPDAASRAHLAALERDTAERLGAHYDAVRDAWRRDVAAALAMRRVPAPLANDPERPSLSLDDLLGEIVAREADALGARLSISTAAAGVGAAAAPALARAAAVRGGRAAASRAAARGASRIGAAAASGAAVCAPGGPVAAACAVLAGAGAWLAADWALLRIDETMHREALERSVEDALAGLRAGIERELVAAYDAAIAAHSAAVQRQITRSFVPAEAGRAARAVDGREPAPATLRDSPATLRD